MSKLDEVKKKISKQDDDFCKFAESQGWDFVDSSESDSPKKGYYRRPTNGKVVADEIQALLSLYYKDAITEEELVLKTIGLVEEYL